MKKPIWKLTKAIYRKRKSIDIPNYRLKDQETWIEGIRLKNKYTIRTTDKTVITKLRNNRNFKVTTLVVNRQNKIIGVEGKLPFSKISFRKV